MADALHPALLPVGFRDLLPPQAEHEASVIARMMGVLHRHGYERVKPPLVEFEETLLTGAGSATGKETFRLIDPVSHRTVAVRADLTPQVARIAVSRLGKEPRPLRLSYAGQVLRVRGGQIRPERQVGQVGAELIGVESAAADVEAVALAAEAVVSVGVEGLSVDLTMPTLVPALCGAFDVDWSRADALRDALDHKDAARVAELGGAAAPTLGRLLAAAGPARRALDALRSIDLPGPAAAERARLAEVVERLGRVAPGLVLTVDPVENRSFEYHTGLSFAFFARGLRGELGRGGRYVAGREPATGFTLYTDSILRAAPEPPPSRRVLVAAGASPEAARGLREAGWVTVAALDGADPGAEARRLKCGHVLAPGAIEPAALGS